MSDLHDRFERLARRGSMRGGDAVLEAARRDADGFAVRSIDARPVEGIDGLAVEPIALQPEPVRRRRRFGTAVAACGAAASLVVGSLAVGSLVGTGSGSDSPTGAVRQLADAISHEDPLAAAAVLAPEEVRSLSSTVDAAERRAQTLALARRADAPLAGVDLTIDGLDLNTETVAPGFAKVTVAGGTYSARSHNGELSPLMQQVLRNSHDGSTHAQLATLGEGARLPTFVMTVERNGHWYVSAAYTALEYVREANDLPPADFGSGARAIATLGADTPERAVSLGVDALSRGDWAALIALAPPDELPVYDYRAALEQLGVDTTPRFTIDHMDTTATVDGDTAKVKLTASGQNSAGDRWSFDGACFGFQNAEAGSSTAVGPEDTCDTAAFSIIPLTANQPGNGRAATITVTKQGGRWFVSPVGTGLDLLDHAIAGVTARTIYTLLNVPQEIPPDGRLALGAPVTLPGNEYGDRVYTYTGHAGEHLLALVKPADAARAEGYVTETRVFDSQGKELEGGAGLLEGQALTLPSDGTYTIAVESFVPATFTLWDAEGAPEVAKHPPFPGGTTGECTFAIGGGESCTGVNSTPPTSAGGQSSSATSSTVPESVP